MQDRLVNQECTFKHCAEWAPWAQLIMSALMGDKPYWGARCMSRLSEPGILILNAADGLREMTAAGAAGVLVYIDR